MIELEKVKIEDKDKLYHLLQFALYDGSFYIDNVICMKKMLNYYYNLF